MSLSAKGGGGNGLRIKGNGSASAFSALLEGVPEGISDQSPELSENRKSADRNTKGGYPADRGCAKEAYRGHSSLSSRPSSGGESTTKQGGDVEMEGCAVGGVSGDDERGGVVDSALAPSSEPCKSSSRSDSSPRGMSSAKPGNGSRNSLRNGQRTGSMSGLDSTGAVGAVGEDGGAVVAKPCDSNNGVDSDRRKEVQIRNPERRDGVGGKPVGDASTSSADAAMDAAASGFDGRNPRRTKPIEIPVVESQRMVERQVDGEEKDVERRKSAARETIGRGFTGIGQAGIRDGDRDGKGKNTSIPLPLSSLPHAADGTKVLTTKTALSSTGGVDTPFIPPFLSGEPLRSPTLRKGNTTGHASRPQAAFLAGGGDGLVGPRTRGRNNFAEREERRGSVDGVSRREEGVAFRGGDDDRGAVPVSGDTCVVVGVEDGEAMDLDELVDDTGEKAEGMRVDEAGNPFGKPDFVIKMCLSLYKVRGCCYHYSSGPFVPKLWT